MNKKILIGSMLVFTMLLLMPSIPAIQLNTIEDKAYNDMIEQIDFKEVKIKELEQIKYPLLYILVRFLLDCRFIRCVILAGISCEVDWWHGFYTIEVIHPILYSRFISLFLSTIFLYGFWLYISEELEWNWEFPYYISK